MGVLIRKIPSRLHLGESRSSELVDNQRLFHWVREHLLQSLSKTNIFGADVTKNTLFEHGTGDATTRIHGRLLSRNDVVISSHAIFYPQF